MGIPRGCLPELRPSEGHFGMTDAGLCGEELPITGIVADQQASLLGHGCEEPGDVKVTFGTSGVVALNLGSETPLRSGLLTSVAWTDRAGRTKYELEGSAFHSGYTLQWLTERFGAAVLSPDGMVPSALGPDDRVYLLPAFTTMGAPRWTPRSGAVITGLGMDTQNADIMRAGVEAMAFQAYDLFAAMDDARDGSSSDVAVDGGGATNDYLCQMLADLLQREVVRPRLQDITSAGAAKAALAGAGQTPDRWFGQDRSRIDRFEPGTGASYAREGYQRWVDLVETVLR
jgi:glycerol kinase